MEHDYVISSETEKAATKGVKSMPSALGKLRAENNKIEEIKQASAPPKLARRCDLE